MGYSYLRISFTFQEIHHLFIPLLMSSMVVPRKDMLTHSSALKLIYWKEMQGHIKEFFGAVMCAQNRASLTSRIITTLTNSKTNLGGYISMDFVEGLSSSNCKTTILLVVDRLSKYAQVYTSVTCIYHCSVVRLFFDNVFKVHGLPRTIVCDLYVLVHFGGNYSG